MLGWNGRGMGFPGFGGLLGGIVHHGWNGRNGRIGGIGREAGNWAIVFMCLWAFTGNLYDRETTEQREEAKLNDKMVG